MRFFNKEKRKKIKEEDKKIERLSKEEEYIREELELQRRVEEEKEERKKVFIPRGSDDSKTVIHLTEEEKRDIAIYKRRLANGETEKSARAGLKTITDRY